MMNSQVINLAILFGGMQLGKKFNFEDPMTLFGLRGAYVLSNLIILAIYLYIGYAISKKNDLTTVKYVESATPMNPEEKLVVTTVKEYDEIELKKQQRSALMGVAMMGFMHLYMKYSQPLIVQSIMPLKNLCETKLFQIHVLNKTGSDFNRPFLAPPGLFGMSATSNIKTDKKSIEAAENKAVKKDE